MTTRDIEAGRGLLAQLGYDLGVDEVERRFQAVVAAPGHRLMAAERAGRVVGLCHAYERAALDKPPEVVVQALVVDEAARQAGVGAALMAAVEAWALARGFGSIALSSEVSRVEAHGFYEGLGYRCVATSQVFRKELSDEGSPWR